MNHNEITRVSCSDAAAALIRELRTLHGDLMFHQSGGCCDGSAPMCYVSGEFRVGRQDVYLGLIENCPFYMAADQFGHWRHTHLTIDVVEGRGQGFSLEAPAGKRFLTRSRVFTDEEDKILADIGDPPRGDTHHPEAVRAAA
ncbi:MAG: DUF779 domain-containing protein [Gammaproteobacteria bacterium AqS3]|nr:DUF779 domain-containing protein [Gammaproteobacteria bacterium AqS3]